MGQSWAVVFEAPNVPTFRRIEVPEAGPEEVVVRTTWSWISNGTEGSFLRGERHNGETPASAERPAPFPIVPGYQRVGEVITAGPESGYEPGETVFVTITRVAGLAASHGGHVHTGPAHHSQVRRIPADGPPAEAYAGLVLTQVGYNCGSRPTLAPGERVVVVGDGQIGHWCAQTLVQRGATILLAGRHDARLMAHQPWVDRAVNTRREDLVEAVRAWAPEGIRAIIDTIGSVETIERLFMLLRPFGHIVSAGYHHDRGKIDIQLLRFREATLHAPSGWTAERLDATLAGVRDGWLKTLPLVTDRLPAPDVAEAWRRIAEERERTLGVLLDWREVSE